MFDQSNWVKIALHKHRDRIKPSELDSLIIWGRFVLQRGRFSTKYQHQNMADQNMVVMDLRDRRNLWYREVCWHYRWSHFFPTDTQKLISTQRYARVTGSEISNPPEESECILLMLMSLWQWLHQCPKDRLKTTCKVSELVDSYWSSCESELKYPVALWKSWF